MRLDGSECKSKAGCGVEFGAAIFGGFEPGLTKLTGFYSYSLRSTIYPTRPYVTSKIEWLIEPT